MSVSCLSNDLNCIVFSEWTSGKDGGGGGGPVDGQCREVVRHDMRNVVSVHDNNDERY